MTSLSLRQALQANKDEKGARLGKALLKDALARIAQAAEPQARKFHEHFSFEASPSHELHLMLKMKDLRKALP